MPYDRPAPPAAGPPSRRSRAALAAAATLLALLACEAALRSWFPEIGRLRSLVVNTDDDRGFVLRTDGQVPFNGVFELLPTTIVWQANRQGLREDHEIDPTPERFRIATFGDSETFGWSVPLEATFQRRMQTLDPDVEVLNFGVPGYNVVNVREHLERNVAAFDPDLVIYLVNKNDFNEAVELTPLSLSYVLLYARFAWHFTIGKEIRRSHRDDADRLEMFGREVDRMTRVLAARDTPLVLGFLRWSNHQAVWPSAGDAGADGGGKAAVAAAHMPARFWRRLVDVERVVDGEARRDGHWVERAHEKMARLFCAEISGTAGGCRPPGWQRGAVAAAPRARTVSAPL